MKHIASQCLYNLPSGVLVHPCRLIHKDGTLMWKHALLYNNKLSIPQDQAQEAHIIKTAQRLEELNSWVSLELEPWDCFIPAAWYVPTITELSSGISVYFKHFSQDMNKVYDLLLPHIQDHETLEQRSQYLFFKRC
tara:strand:+ start:2288 stop:2695 length:408 start_codon:yes stop_codon:yes gene_type:complete